MSDPVAAGQCKDATACAAVLTELWKDDDRFIVLDDRFDGGERFQSLLQAWRDDPCRCAQLHVITASPEIVDGCTSSALREEIADRWPPITANMHRLAFDGGRVQWMLVPTPMQAALRTLVAAVDVFACSAPPAADPYATRRWAKALARLAGADARLLFDAGSVCDSMRHALRSAGFAEQPDTDPADRRGADIERWRHAPQFTSRQPPARSGAGARSRDPVLIVGAGLAGCAMAWALAEQGRESFVFERRATVALETSGNPAGLFHGIVNPQDGAHARFNRGAALEAQRAVAIALAQHQVQGSARGLLRLGNALGNDDLPTMRATLARLGLPGDYVLAVSAQQASELSGLALRQAAWWYPGGGWVQPAGLARSFLERAGPRVALRADSSVHSLTRESGLWQLRDERGSILAAADVVVLANAGDALRLLQPWMPASQPHFWPLLRVRGQITTLPVAAIGALGLPRVPIAGAGYLLPGVDGLAIFGATSQADDDDPAVRDSDHRLNLEQLARLTGIDHRIEPTAHGIDGRTGWRWSTDDRLPVLGAVPDWTAALGARRLEQPVHVPRLQGLYACTAFGSRGITWAALAAQVVAASITGAPMPIEAGLLDSVDAARWVVRAATRRTRRVE